MFCNRICVWFSAYVFACTLLVICISGTIKNLSPALWQLTHLTVLFLNDNQLTRIPPDIKQLQNLHCLDLSSNKLRSLPSELGDLIKLR